MAKADKSPRTDAQREIMEVIWERSEVTVSEVHARLASSRKLARNTVQTMIVRLEEKGWLKHRVQGRTFVYSARRPRNVSLGAKVAQMVDRLFSSSPEEMVTALIEYRGLTQDEAERIRGMIDEVEGKSTATKNPEKKS